MRLQDCNPYIRAAQIQPAVLEGRGARMAYDHRLFYILEGNGELILQDRTVPLSPDMLFLLRPAVGYHFRGKLRVALLNFDLTRAADQRTEPVCPPPVEEFDAALVFDTACIDELGELRIATDARRCKEDLLEIIRSFSEADPLADALCSGLLKKLLAELLMADRTPRDAAEALVERVRRHVMLYAAELDGNAAVGEAFGYHPVYLAQLFREHTGTTLHQAILGNKLALACRWLTHTDRSIEQIAFDSGFSSRSHFCTVFRRQMGMTPNAYRKK